MSAPDQASDAAPGDQGFSLPHPTFRPAHPPGTRHTETLRETAVTGDEQGGTRSGWCRLTLGSTPLEIPIPPSGSHPAVGRRSKESITARFIPAMISAAASSR